MSTPQAPTLGPAPYYPSTHTTFMEAWLRTMLYCSQENGPSVPVLIYQQELLTFKETNRKFIISPAGAAYWCFDASSTFKYHAYDPDGRLIYCTLENNVMFCPPDIVHKLTGQDTFQAGLAYALLNMPAGFTLIDKLAERFFNLLPTERFPHDTRAEKAPNA